MDNGTTGRFSRGPRSISDAGHAVGCFAAELRDYCRAAFSGRQFLPVFSVTDTRRQAMRIARALGSRLTFGGTSLHSVGGDCNGTSAQRLKDPWERADSPNLAFSGPNEFVLDRMRDRPDWVSCADTPNGLATRIWRSSPTQGCFAIAHELAARPWERDLTINNVDGDDF